MGFFKPNVEKMEAKRDVKGLIKALWNKDYKDYYLKMRAAEALGNIGDARAVEPLTKSLNDKNKDVRKAAKEALKRIEAKES